MDPNAMLMAGLILLPAFGLVVWVWLTMARDEDELRASCETEALRYELEPPPATDTQGSRWRFRAEITTAIPRGGHGVQHSPRHER